jgi:lipid II:glycine glycyltransferase (peptidoglycan interpeptide bridge formation enzyme)
MAKITIRNVNNERSWENFLAGRPEANFLQSWHWGEFHKALGNRIHRTGFYNGEQLMGVMLSVVEHAKRGRYLTVPGGPIIDWKNPGLMEAFVKEIKKIAKLNNCVFVRVRPQLESNDFSKSIFAQNKFINAPMHLHAELTSQLDIIKPEEELLANMRKTTRHEIRKAISLPVKITTTNNPSVIKRFYNLQISTSKRQKFVPFSYQFLYEQFKVFSQRNKALLYNATYQNKLLAQAFIIFYGQEAIYHYGASTQEGRKYPGAHLIQWKAIQEAKKRKMARYNFWGVSPIENTKHRFYGVSIFKRGFGGQDVQYLHAQDLVISQPRYLFNYIIEVTRKHARRV